MELDKQSKKELSTAYKQSFKRMGIYQVRNTQNGKALVCGSMNLAGAKNRIDFSKSTNLNPMNELRKDWEAFGPQSFEYEELDEIKPREEFMGDPSELKAYQEEVDALLELWLEKLQPYDEKGYNKRRH